MVKRALITGITGQDGSYLADYLVGLGYQVYGLVRRTSIDSEQRMYRIAHLMANSSYLHILPGSLESYSSVCNAVIESKPDEVYHLGAQSFVKVSWEDIGSTMNINVQGTVNVLEAVRHFKKDAKVYLACSSEMFGNVLETPQRETTPFNPRSLPLPSDHALAQTAGRLQGNESRSEQEDRHHHARYRPGLHLQNGAHGSPGRGNSGQGPFRTAFPR